MNIVFIGPFGLQPKGTVSVRALPLAKALVQRGHTVTLLVPPWDDPQRAGQSWTENGVQVVNVALPPGVPLLFHLMLTRTLVAQTLALKPDVVHFFKPKAYAGLAHIVMWQLRRLGLTSTRLVLDSDDWEQAWNDLLPYTALQKRFFVWQENWGIVNADAITVASRALGDLVARTRRVSTGITYVPNGYLAEWQQEPADGTAVREQWQLGQAPLILLYSRFVEFRLERVVGLVRQVAQLMPEARWLLLGRGLYGEDQKLAQLLAQADLLEPYVHFAGWPVDNRSAYFAAADVAIYPYDDRLLNRTKCSVKLVEMLLAGLPLITDAVGQNKEYIEHDESGLLLPVEDDDSFAAAILDLLHDPHKRQALGQAGSTRIRENFNWLHLAQKIEQVYRL